MFPPQRKIVLALALVAAAFVWPNAGAAEIGGRPLGMVPHHKGGGPAGPLASPFAVGADEPPTLGAMTYHGGRVMHSVTIHAIYWFPSGSYVDPSGLGYRGYVDRFLNDVAHDSGGFSNVYASDTEYTDTLTGHILYSQGAPTSTLDTTPFPASGCTAIDPSGNPLTGEPCLTDAQIHQEVERDAGATGYSNLYVVFLPSGIDECFDATSGTCSTNSFCAYHTGWGTLSDPLLYAVEPYYAQGDPGCDPSSVGAAQDPNGNDADVVISTLSHETNEAITDPAGNAWFDSGQNEDGDKCAYNYGSRIGAGPSGGQYNELVNGDPYFIQLEWSNALGGCYQTGAAPTISGFNPDRGPPGTVVAVTGTNFYDQTGTVSLTLGGVSIPYTVTSPTSLHFTVPSTSAGGVIIVRTIGGTVTSGTPFVVAPKITSFTPTAAPAGSSVTINGIGFAGVDSVTFGGAAATSVTPVSATQVKAVVPPDATVGPVVVSSATGSSDPFGSFKPLPRVTSFTPEDGDPASPPTVTITGTNLLDADSGGTNGVKFGTTLGTISSDTATQMVVTPPGAPFSSGKITVVTPGGSGVSTDTFSYTKATSVLPASAAAGATITIAGQGLSSTTGVVFSGHSGAVALFGTPTATLKVVVPDDATSGPLTVVTPRASVSTPNFKPLPKITNVSPLDGKAGTPITVTGTNLSDVSSVKLGTSTASFTPVSATEVDATVPGGSFSSGRVTVVTPGGTATSAQLFGVTKVTSFTASAAAGATITLGGQGLSTASSVDFAGHPAVPVSGRPTATSVRVVVPNDATAGPLTVHTPETDPGGVATLTSFKPLPKITNVTPLDGKAGTQVTITGTNLLGADSGGANGVKLGTTPAPAISSDTATQIVTAVPAAPFSSGRVTVVTPGGTGVSMQLFAVTKVTSFTASAAAGTTITLSGQGLSTATSVDFTGRAGVAVSGTPTATSVRVVVPDDATYGPLTVHTPETDPAGVVTATSFKPLPKITNVAPLDGEAGTQVTLTGTNLTGATSVKFGTYAAQAVLSDTSTQIVATAPAAPFSSGRVTVATSAGTAVSPLTFALTKVTTETPAAAAGATVTISGQGLSSATTVDFVGHPGVPVSGTPTATAVRVVVPNDATLGALTVHTPNIDASGLPTTTQFKPLPKIASLLPNPAQPGQSVTIGGTNLANVTALKLGAVVITPASGDATSVTFTVPDNAVSGTLSLTTTAGLASTALRVEPLVTGFDSVGHAAAGTSLLVDGSGFTGVSSVRFTGSTGAQNVASVFHVVSPAQIQVTVPTAAVSGPIAITNAGGTAETGPFTVDPKITSFTPVSAAAGQTVTVYGSGFGIASSTRALTLSGETISSGVTYVSPNQLRFVVPADASTGVIGVTVDGDGPATSTAQLAVTFSVQSVSALVAPARSSITITGAGFTGVTAVRFDDTGTPVTVTPSVDSDNQLHVFVPTGNVDGTVAVYKGSLRAAIPGTFRLLSYGSWPGALAKPGKTLGIDGTGFTGAERVDFYNAGDVTPLGSDDAPVVTSDTHLTAVVPAGFSGGSVSVVGASGIGLATELDGLSTWSAPVGSSVTMAGSELGTFDLTFAGASPVSGTTGSIADVPTLTFTVPGGATSGTLSFAGQTSVGSFSVLPSITSLGETSAPTGEVVTVSGKALSRATATVGGVAASVTNDTYDSVDVTIPDGAAAGAGDLVITTPAGSAQAAFTVTMTITDSSPRSGTAGTSVTITGAGFTGATAVDFGGTPAASYTIDSDTQITVTVPNGAASGPITVVGPNGTTVVGSAFDFTIN